MAGIARPFAKTQQAKGDFNEFDKHYYSDSGLDL